MAQQSPGSEGIWNDLLLMVALKQQGPLLGSYCCVFGLLSLRPLLRGSSSILGVLGKSRRGLQVGKEKCREARLLDLPGNLGILGGAIGLCRRCREEGEGGISRCIFTSLFKLRCLAWGFAVGVLTAWFAWTGEEVESSGRTARLLWNFRRRKKKNHRLAGCVGALCRRLCRACSTGKMASGPGSIAFGHHLIKGKSRHAMEDYFVAELRKVNDHELGLFAIYDGHLGHHVADYLQQNLFNNILNESGFWRDPKGAIQKAYLNTDGIILENAPDLGPGGSTAVTAILIDSKNLLVANVGDSRAIISQAGKAIQLSVDHEPGAPTEKGNIENRGGFVSNMPGDVPRVDGQLAVARAFGDKSLKVHLSATPDIKELEIDEETELLILASDGLWKVMDNQEAVDLVKKIKDPTAAAKQLAAEAVNRKSKDDISCIVVRFK